MKRSILLISFLLWFLSSLAQIHSKEYVIKNFANIRLAFINNYEPNADSAKNNCWKGCVFIRFNINNKHQLINVAYTAITPLFIKDAVVQTIKLINQQGGINILKLKNAPRKTYILPFIIANNEGCGFPTGWENDGYSNRLTEKEKLIYERRQGDYDQLEYSLENITNFTDGKKTDTMNCVLLTTVVMPIGMN